VTDESSSPSSPTDETRPDGPGQHPLVHETPAAPGIHDSNEDADDAVEIHEPDGTPIERTSG
jgi:hypothetical protein